MSVSSEAFTLVLVYEPFNHSERLLFALRHDSVCVFLVALTEGSYLPSRCNQSLDVSSQSEYLLGRRRSVVVRLVARRPHSSVSSEASVARSPERPDKPSVSFIPIDL